MVILKIVQYIILQNSVEKLKPRKLSYCIFITIINWSAAYEHNFGLKEIGKLIISTRYWHTCETVPGSPRNKNPIRTPITPRTNTIQREY